MRGLSEVVLCVSGWWLSVGTDGMSSPLLSRLKQSAYPSLVTASPFGDRMRCVLVVC